MDFDTYDAGLLNDYGGGEVSWWQDYIRCELARAHDFYVEQLDNAYNAGRQQGLTEAADVANKETIPANGFFRDDFQIGYDSAANEIESTILKLKEKP